MSRLATGMLKYGTPIGLAYTATKFAYDKYKQSQQAASPQGGRSGGGGATGGYDALKMKQGDVTSGGDVKPGVIDFASKIQQSVPGFEQFTALAEGKQRLIRWRTPEEIGEPVGEFDAGQRHQWQEHENDDRDAVDRRLGHIQRSIKHDLDPLFRFRMAKLVEHILHHDHGARDNGPAHTSHLHDGAPTDGTRASGGHDDRPRCCAPC